MVSPCETTLKKTTKPLPMTSFNSDVILLNEPKSRQFFPENFSNEIYYSNLEEFNYITYKSNFSIKYVIDGEENYILDGKRHTARSGQYLLVNDGRMVETTPECNSEAISIFLNMDIVSEVAAGLNGDDHELLENFDLTTGSSVAFFENSFTHNDLLGTALKQLYRHIISTEHSGKEFNSETYYHLAEQLIRTQLKINDQIGNIDKVKFETRKELYRRVLMARDYIEDTATDAFDFNALSTSSGLSKYHLIRVFKTVFGTTPYRYFIGCRIRTARHDLVNSEENITEIAYKCGFPDVFSFSKIFKNLVGVTPSEYKAQFGK